MSAPVSRNALCPCGSGTKFKRCCANKLDLLARLKAEDERVGCALLDWAHAEHDVALGELLAKSGALAFRHRFNPGSEQLRVTWAVTDGRPADGGPPLAARYAEGPDLEECERPIARRLADASLRLYRVRKVVSRLWVELEPFDLEMASSGGFLRVFSDMVSTALQPESVILARVIDVEGLASFWGPVCGYPATSMRTLCAFVRTVDITTAEGSLAVLGFDPYGYAPPFPGGLTLRATEWRVEDASYVIDQLEELEDSGRLTSLGIEIGAPDEPWSFAWLDLPRSDAVNLGGVPEDQDGLIELARVVVHRHRLVVSSTSSAVLTEVGDWLGREVEGLAPWLLRAA